MKILITGATGFIGKTLTKTMLNVKCNISIVVRKKINTSENVKQFVIGDFGNEPDFYDALNGVDCVIHLAGKAHIVDENKSKTLNDFRKINTDLTLDLAKQAVKSGVKRLIFLSSIRVNGNQNFKNTQAFLETDIPSPQEDYAVSKYEAEQGLLALAEKTSLEVVIIRPPLVYGANAPGNFARLINWIDCKYPAPLPLGSVNNSRSFIALDNLIDFIILCATHKNAKNEIFVIADDESVSTTQLLNKLAQAFDKKVFLIPIPVKLMIFMATLIGKKADAIRLFSSLKVDNSKAKNLLDWRPITNMNKVFKEISSEKNI